MKRILKLLCMVMAIVTMVMSPMQVLAAGQKQYIKDISIGYGDEGKAALEAAGFTVWADLNANKNGNGSAVWVGYKTTTVASEAVTDIAVMNMKGGYSFDAYQQELQEISANVTAMLQEGEASFNEFRTNYNNGSPYAVNAAKLLDVFTEDDTGKKMSEILLDASTSQELLHQIFMMGNTEIMDIVEDVLALGCADVGDDTLLTRLENAEYSEDLDPTLNTARSRLFQVFPEFRDVLAEGANAYAQYEASGCSSEEEYMNSLSEGDQLSFAYYYGLYQLAAQTPFGDTGMTLYDFSQLDTDEENEDGWVLCDELLELLAQSMTPGQRGVVFSVGIAKLLEIASSDGDSAAVKITEAVASINDLTNGETISVYYNVDRTLFEDSESVALTSSALRDKAATNSADFGTAGTGSAKIDKTLLGIGSAVGAVGLASAGFALAYYLYAAQEFVSGPMVGNIISHFNFGHYELVSFFGTYSSTITAVFSVIGAIAIIAAVVMIIIALSGLIFKPEEQKIEYTRIPRAIVDMDYDTYGSKLYYPYYAAKLVTASEGETDSLKLYGDLNGLNNKDEWDVLYYSKDHRIGTPLTVDMLVNDTGVLDPSKQSDYVAIHRFGSTAAANLNQYNTGTDTQVYVFLRTAASDASMAGSVFGAGSITAMVVTFLLGGGIAAAVTYTLTKKKAKASEAC